MCPNLEKKPEVTFHFFTVTGDNTRYLVILESLKKIHSLGSTVSEMKITMIL